MVAAIARARHARMFHPDGDVTIGHAVPALTGAYATLGARLAGPIMARFSGALRRRGHDGFDVLGIALRFRAEGEWATDVLPHQGDQDLLFATILSPFTMPSSPFTTRSGDFLSNRYYAVSPFEVAGVGRLKFRLVPMKRPHLTTGSRVQRLTQAVIDGDAVFQLEARPVFHWPWLPVATIACEQMLAVDQVKLRFDPYQSDKGIVPSGLIHAIRPSAYGASQAQR